MTDLSMSPAARRDYACAAAGWPEKALSLAAGPTFAVLALWTGLFGGQPDVPCMSTPIAPSLSNMALMYALMSLFHAAPWLKWIARR